jgi:hypothetical protein
MDEKTEIAALWGSAENEAYSMDRRLKYALTALDKMSSLVPGWEK